MNIYDISQKAGVSIATVSRVINKNPNVREKTKQKVLQVIRENGYTPNVFARGLGHKSMQTVGILCTDSSDLYLAQAVYFLERELRLREYNSILCCTGYKLKDKKRSLELLLTKQTDALILIGSSFIEEKETNSQYIRDAAGKVPVMLLNGHMEAENIYSILCDDYNAIHDAVSKLLENGKKDTLFLYRALTYSGNQKRMGYEDAYKKFGLPVNKDLIQLCNGDVNHTKEFLTMLAEKGIYFDGVISVDDQLAIGAIKYAKKFHIAIPEQLEIIGYNNSILGTCCEPELTTIDNKVEAICMTTTATLMSVLGGKNIPSKTMLSADLITRDTTYTKP